MSNSAALFDFAQSPRAGRKPPAQPLPEVAAAGGKIGFQRNGSEIQLYLDLGYTAVSHVLIDHWMSEMSGTEFKLAVLFLRKTIGDRAKRASSDLRLGMTLTEMQTRTGADREAIVRAVRDLEAKELVSAQRAHRKTTVYALRLDVLLGPRVGESDPIGSERPTQNVRFESGEPTQGFDLGRQYRRKGAASESGLPTPYKEIKAAAADCPLEGAERGMVMLTELERAEVRRIGAGLGIQIDGKNAATLKVAARQAGLTLSHLRWFLRDETFSGAKNRMAVLLTIAKEFRERAEGIEWPEDLNARDKCPTTRSLRVGEIE